MAESKYPPHLRKHAELAIALITRTNEVSNDMSLPGLEDHAFAKSMIADFMDEFECSHDEVIMGLLQMNMVGLSALAMLLGKPLEQVITILGITNQEV